MPPQVLIVGLRQIGTAIGLALRQSSHELTVFGYDSDKSVARAALQAGAYEHRVLDPRKTAHQVDMVVLTLAPDPASDLVEHLVQALRPGAALLDLTPRPHTPRALSALADKRAQVIRGALVVSIDRLLTPQETPPPDAHRYRAGQLGLAIAPETRRESIELALAVGDALGTEPFFIDAAELDYASAAVDTLPALLGLLALRSLSATPGWPNVQRLAGPAFATYAHHAPADGTQLTDHIWSRRVSLLAQLDGLADEVAGLRAALQAESSEQLQTLVAQALRARQEWIETRRYGEARPGASLSLPTRGILGNLFGFGPRRPPGGDQD
jgi:prephenate dehydrogenase